MIYLPSVILKMSGRTQAHNNTKAILPLSLAAYGDFSAARNLEAQ